VLRILVVEDEPLLRWALSESLGSAGHVVTAAEDGAAALRALDDHAGAIDVVLLDFRLPDSNDLALLQRVLHVAPGRPVVMMTACSTPELTRDALALGAFRVVDKPFEMQAIEACLRDAHAARRPST
jgi:DNA-binding NtrC family response regulator